MIRGQHDNDDSVPPSGKRCHGIFPSFAEKHPWLCCFWPEEALGHVGVSKRTQRRTRDIDIRSGFWHSVTGARNVLRDRIPPRCSIIDQLKLARANPKKNFTPAALDQKKFKHTPFISRNLRKADYAFIKDSSLAKSALQPRYSVGPFRVISKDWKNSVFRLQLTKGPDNILVKRLKAAIPVAS